MAPTPNTDSCPDTTITPTRRHLLTGLGATIVPFTIPVTDRTTAAQQPTPEPVVTFKPPNLPDTLTIDTDGTIYLTMALTGDLIQRTSAGDQTTIATLTTGNGLLLGHTPAPTPTNSPATYAVLNSRTRTTHGVWHIPHQTNQDPRRIIQFRPKTALNDLAVTADGTTMYFSAATATPQRGGSGGGGRTQYSISENGYYWTTGVPENPKPTRHTPRSLTPPSDPVDLLSLAGPTGITIHENTLYVLNPHGGQLLRVPLDTDGKPRQAESELVVESPRLEGGDGITFGTGATLYVAVPTQNKVVQIQVDQSTPQVETVVASDAFDFPTDVAVVSNQTTAPILYICNSALRTYRKTKNQQQQAQSPPAPSVMKVMLPTDQ